MRNRTAVIVFLVAIVCGADLAAEAKPRVIVLTDIENEPD